MARVGTAHAVDQMQRQFGLGAPGVECGVPFVGAAGPESIEKALEVGNEGRGCRVCLQAIPEPIDALIEVRGEAG